VDLSENVPFLRLFTVAALSVADVPVHAVLLIGRALLLAGWMLLGGFR
jgi:hypothetical protein